MDMKITPFQTLALMSNMLQTENGGIGRVKTKFGGGLFARTWEVASLQLLLTDWVAYQINSTREYASKKTFPKLPLKKCKS